MGLDMFLFSVKKGVKPSDDNVTERAYWRKANMVRQWFVDNTDYDVDADCVYHKIEKEKLWELADTCVSVLYMRREDYAAAEMPTAAGFFFGDTDYDEYYYEDVRNTLKQILDIFENVDFDKEDIYYYEWW